ncbi:N-formylglutamate amidohydrolase [Pedomonas mirosovicensis]|uniref:N-formylglutamate amidohydrolase n=1 Tax=Pedomonas mirosovicensis TaxID=2908641 RepID=UPI002167840B|nr:N-formylglutamate amidohydrolase [Pedomonas mirosovicensis]MCH8685189.1 N-formylglutamate amidohydrolase [Pedomonas mirosovicensis]
MLNLVPSGPRKTYLAQRLLFVADHASNFIPESYENLGVDERYLQEHIAWDIGSLDVARAVRNRTGGRLWPASVSRLLIDFNRDPDHPGLIPESSDGVLIPGNMGLTAEERQRRLDRYFHPYHNGLSAEIDSMLESDGKPALISMHSFTPRMNGFERPWHIGLLYNQDDRLSRRAIDWLRREPGLVVGDNEPYSGRLLNYTMDRHAEARGLPYLSIEIRQDLISTPEGVADWSERLSALLRFLL